MLPSLAPPGTLLSFPLHPDPSLLPLLPPSPLPSVEVDMGLGVWPSRPWLQEYGGKYLLSKIPSHDDTGSLYTDIASWGDVLLTPGLKAGWPGLSVPLRCWGGQHQVKEHLPWSMGSWVATHTFRAHSSQMSSELFFQMWLQETQLFVDIFK